MMDSSINEKRILFVDDQEMIVEIMAQQLRYLGYQAEVFQNPCQALVRFQQDPEAFDLVFSDMNMPQMSGIELLETIRRIRPQMPAILATGDSDEQDRVAAKRLGCRFVLKPIELEPLAKVIQETIVASR